MLLWCILADMCINYGVCGYVCVIVVKGYIRNENRVLSLWCLMGAFLSQ